MAWYDIEHICGHTSERQIYGPNVRGEREQRAKRFGEQACPACLQHERDKGNRVAAAQAEREGWPALTGSAKQIAWAQTVRAGAVDDLAQRVKAAYAATPALIATATALLVGHSRDATWWIDHRDLFRWLDVIKDRPEWAEAVTKIRPSATLAEIQHDFRTAQSRTDLDRAMFRADVAREAGQLTDEQYRALEAQTLHFMMRLEGKASG